jgi:thymidylate synthase
MPRNLTEAFLSSLRKLMDEGDVVPSRNGDSKEIYCHQVRIDHPEERVIMTPARGANIMAQLAEAMWIMGGRDDMEFLSRYLPRARDYSDDGETWRAGYGPRLRAWPLGDNPSVHSVTNPAPDKQVDQVEECLKLLCENLETRRAVAVIFDPARDFCESKDIPCNNWLHFLVRDGKLNLTVGVRSNDAIWGFSGINMFEWSVLMQMMAHWLDIEVGKMVYTASSFHLYEYHFDKAEKILARDKGKTLYEWGFRPPTFSTGWEDFGPAMAEFFNLEEKIAEGSLPYEDIDLVTDEFLRTVLHMLNIHACFQSGSPIEDLVWHVSSLPECDLKVGAIDWLMRQKRMRKEGGFLKLIRPKLSPEMAAYFDWYVQPQKYVELPYVFEVLKVLHHKKTLSYGDSWKKHGEILGLFSNITRKRDRITSLAAGAQGTADEGILDTLSDLCVYAAKYITLIAELYPVAFMDYLRSPDYQVVYPCEVDVYLPGDVNQTVAGFNDTLDMLLARPEIRGAVGASNFSECLSYIELEYKRMEAILTAPERTERGELVVESATWMAICCAQAICNLANETPSLWASYTRTVEKL